MFEPPIDNVPSIEEMINDIIKLQIENTSLKAEIENCNNSLLPTNNTVVQFICTQYNKQCLAFVNDGYCSAFGSCQFKVQLK
jgi:hypothetical protein